jgi:hypothetical protein
MALRKHPATDRECLRGHSCEGLSDAMKLLVAVDYPQSAQQVIDEVARRPCPVGSTACIFHIIGWFR